MNILRKVFPGGSEGEAPADNAPVAPSLTFPEVPFFDSGVNPTPKLECTLAAHDERVWMVSWHPSGKILATCSSDKSVKLWSRSEGDEVNWKCIGTLDGEHERTVRCISWSPDGEYLAASSFDATVSIWKKTSPQFEMEVEGVLDGHENEVKSVAWSADGQYLATCSRDKTVWIWDRSTGEYECAGVLTGHTQDVKSVRWSNVKNQLYSCGYDDTVKVWEESPGRKDDWHCTQTLVKHEGTVWEIAVQPSNNDAAIIASCSDDKTVMFWFPDQEGRLSAARTSSGVHVRTVYSVDWAPSMHAKGETCGTVLGCASGDDSFSLLEVLPNNNTDGTDPCPFTVRTIATQQEAHVSDVNCIRFSNDTNGGKTLQFATCSDDGSVKIWKIE